MRGKSFVMTLCYKCKADFEDTGNNYIRRVDTKQIYKEKCTFCNYSTGYDYEIKPKAKGRKEERL